MPGKGVGNHKNTHTAKGGKAAKFHKIYEHLLKSYEHLLKKVTRIAHSQLLVTHEHLSNGVGMSKCSSYDEHLMGGMYAVMGVKSPP